MSVQGAVLTQTREEPSINIPVRIVEAVIASGVIDELEDWLLAQDSEFIARMERARADDLAGRGVPWETVKAELGIA